METLDNAIKRFLETPEMAIREFYNKLPEYHPDRQGLWFYINNEQPSIQMADKEYMKMILLYLPNPINEIIYGNLKDISKEEIYLYCRTQKPCNFSKLDKAIAQVDLSYFNSKKYKRYVYNLYNSPLSSDEDE